MTPDLLVIGAGPAGISAALAASSCGVNTLLIDNASAAGGQVYRAPRNVKQQGTVAVDTSVLDPDKASGDALREALAQSDVQHLPCCNVWSITQDFRVDAVGPNGPIHIQPRAIVAAVGANERVVPFDGWTLPGVIGLAAATVLLKGERMLPGNDLVIAGAGPLLYAVAHKMLACGGRVVAVVDVSGRHDWLASVPSLLAEPRNLARGIAWVRDLKRAGVPLLFSHTVRRARTTDEGLVVDIAPVDSSHKRLLGKPETSLRADCLAVGHGLIPTVAVTRSLNAEHEFDERAGGWVPMLDSAYRSTRSGLYAAGECTGVAGAHAAQHAGHICGLTVAFDQGHISTSAWRRAVAPLRRACARARIFGHANARLMAPRRGQLEDVPGNVVVCRCEDVTRAEIEAAIASGARCLNEIKSWTRCAMGPCQGRSCGDMVAALVAHHYGGRALTGSFSQRSPFRPLDVEALTGDYEYDDITIPRAAPP